MPTPTHTLAIVTRLSRPAPFLERVLAGLLKQSGAQIHWSIVVQSPLSAAHKTCLRQADKKGIRVNITKAEPGIPLGTLANMGARAFSSDFILLHDDDDALVADFTGPAIKCLAQTDCVAVACHAAFIHEAGKNKRLDFILSPGDGSVRQSELSSDNVIAVNSLIYRRTAFDNVGGYPEDVSVAEDWLFNIKLIKSGTIFVYPRVCSAVYLRETSATGASVDHTDRNQHKAMRSRIRADEGAGPGPDLEQRLNTPKRKIRRQLDRLVYRINGSFLKR